MTDKDFFEIMLRNQKQIGCDSVDDLFKKSKQQHEDLLLLFSYISELKEENRSLKKIIDRIMERINKAASSSGNDDQEAGK